MSGDEKEQQLQRELAECVMSSSWIWCVVGLGIAIPIGVKTKVGVCGWCPLWACVCW